jgi:tetratricopeptide (TPR) repeat protein
MRKKINPSVTTLTGIQNTLPSPSPPAPPPPPPSISPHNSPGAKFQEKDSRQRGSGKFLGLPLPTGNSKRRLFHRLSDKSIQKHENDDQKALSSPKFRKEGEENIDTQDEDPVIALFEARNKQRVRFCLENNDETSKYDVEKPTALVKESKDIVSNNDDIAQSQQFNIKSFMGRILFNKAVGGEAIEDCENSPIVWESNEVEEESPEILHTKTSINHRSFKVCFEENPEVRAKAVALLEKARKAQYSHHKYRHAVKCYVRANNILSEAKYPDDHPLMLKTLSMLKQAHHVLSCFDNSAKIVKMGIKYEDQNDYIRALKMYTIAYRMRRDQISRTHPSLAVLLNILGSIQVKRGELREAMKIYELALRDVPAAIDDDDEYPPALFQSRDLARAVTFREMGVIFEMWGETGKSLKLYHKSLNCLSTVRENMDAKHVIKDDKIATSPSKIEQASDQLVTIQLRKSFPSYTQSENIHNGSEKGEMEVFFSDRSSRKMHRNDDFEMYDSFFPDVNETVNTQDKNKPLPSSDKSSFADVEVALTFHQIAQLHKKNGHYGRALDAYRASLRGMKFALGEIHPNVAAILGNIGNLQKEMGDLDAAYSTYQDVLGIEVHRLGVSHPEVAISLHNVATIEAGRGNYNQALMIYQKVINLQRRLFGDEHLSVATTSACMGEVYERMGDIGLAIDCYEETLRSKIAVLGRHDLQVARVLHKLGKMSLLRKEYSVADSYTARAVLIYRLHKVRDDHEWLVDAERDRADIDAALALGDRNYYEI